MVAMLRGAMCLAPDRQQDQFARESICIIPSVNLSGNSLPLFCNVSGDAIIICSTFAWKLILRTTATQLVLRRKMPQLAGLWVEPGIPEIKRILLVRKRAPESRLSLRSDTPRVCGLVEKDCACCFSSVIGQVRYLRGHLGPPKKPLGASAV